MRALERFVAAGEQPAMIRRVVRRGLAGELDDTPKPGHPSITRASARVIAGAADAMRGASEAAERLGYRVIALNERVTGESREAALAWLRKVQAVAAGGPACVLSSGETTVRVTGRGRGGRNQEFALSAARELAGGRVKAVASAGTDGIDGPTDAAGGIADTTTAARAAELGLSLESHLNDNNSYAFFAALGDLIVTGPTGTNVGDLQIAIL